MITEKMAETISHFAIQNEHLQKKLDIAVKALREYAELKTIGQEARQALKEIDDSFEKCDEN